MIQICMEGFGKTIRWVDVKFEGVKFEGLGITTRYIYMCNYLNNKAG